MSGANSGTAHTFVSDKHYTNLKGPSWAKAGKRFTDLSDALIKDSIEKEKFIQKNFLSDWGELIEGERPPLDVEDQIKQKERQLIEIKKQLGEFKELNTTNSTFTYSAQVKNPEEGLAKHYRTLKVGT